MSLHTNKENSKPQRSPNKQRVEMTFSDRHLQLKCTSRKE